LRNRLKKLYINGNQIESVPANMVSLSLLEAVNIANNSIQRLPYSWTEKWGTVTPEGILCQPGVETPSCIITVIGNPLTDSGCNASLTEVCAMEE
jgi:Leucine-rich repeat (LRR) protein